PAPAAFSPGGGRRGPPAGGRAPLGGYGGPDGVGRRAGGGAPQRRHGLGFERLAGQPDRGPSLALLPGGRSGRRALGPDGEPPPAGPDPPGSLRHPRSAGGRSVYGPGPVPQAGGRPLPGHPAGGGGGGGGGEPSRWGGGRVPHGGHAPHRRPRRSGEPGQRRALGAGGGPPVRVAGGDRGPLPGRGARGPGRASGRPGPGALPPRRSRRRHGGGRPAPAGSRRAPLNPPAPLLLAPGSWAPLQGSPSPRPEPSFPR